MERNEMHDYVEELQGFGTHGIPRGKAAAILRRVTSHGMRENAKLRSTKLLRPWSRKRAEKVAASTRGSCVPQAEPPAGKCPGSARRFLVQLTQCV